MTVPIPERLRGFPIYRGMLVHHTVFVDDQGVPDFRVVHENNRLNCMLHGLCSLCGQELDVPMVFFGGPLSVENRLFVDGPMHEECADYAAQVCPYLKMESWSHSKRPIELEAEGVEVRTEELAAEGRPRMAFVYANNYRPAMVGGSMLFEAVDVQQVDWDKLPQPEPE